MAELTIPSDYMRSLIEKLRAVMEHEIEMTSEYHDDDEDEALDGVERGDPMVAELRDEIEALDDDHKHELVALVWVGREDFSADEWDEALALAEERHDGPTWRYLLSHPRVADQIASGLEELGYDHVLQDGNY